MKRLAIVVPCYNEEEVFPDTNGTLIELLKDLIKKEKISEDSYVMYVDDGSKDKTWSLISKAHEESRYVHGLKLAGNKGHQNALFAGLMYAKEDADSTISIDADLQDDTKVIEEMVDKFNAGIDIVYGVRNDRTSDTFFKRFTAETFYKVMTFLGSKGVNNHADFRLLSKRVLEELSLYSEAHLYLRGLIPDLGFKSGCVYYARSPRLKGESKYPLSKMLTLAFNGVTSSSDKPLTMIIYFGVAALFVSFVSVIYAIVACVGGNLLPGWISVFASIWFLGGVQLVSLGVIGQYVGKTFIEAKKRPRYYIETHLTHDEK